MEEMWLRVLISFREWLHSYIYSWSLVERLRKTCSHLFQRVASFLQKQSTPDSQTVQVSFSSLSESGFIPTTWVVLLRWDKRVLVLISFREWLHSYIGNKVSFEAYKKKGSHLFQRVASFLLMIFLSIPSKDMLSSHLFQRVASFLRIFQ